jgi:hypothetical protein
MNSGFLSKYVNTINFMIKSSVALDNNKLVFSFYDDENHNVNIQVNVTNQWVSFKIFFFFFEFKFFKFFKFFFFFFKKDQNII